MKLFCLNTPVLLAFLVFNGTLLVAQDPVIVSDTQSIVFELGEVQVLGEKSHPLSLILSRENIALSPKKNVSAALISLPGVNFVHLGPKNDAMLNVRGFDLRQVPVYMDGVPVYVSYDGYVDLGRFLVSDLSRITVSRGEASLLLGPNALGGAINLVSRKPAARLEMDAASAITLDSRGYGGLQSELNVGSRKEYFYFQAGIAFVDSKPFVLSGKDAPGKNKSQVQFNSAMRDLNSSIKFGYTPNQRDSYVISYHFQDASKGVPVYSGLDPAQRIRYWQFPDIKKQGLHFNSKTFFGEESYLQTRLYYDDYFSDLRSYDDSTLLSQVKRSSFTSIYDDETLGGALILALAPAERHRLNFAFHAIYDHHREHNIHPREEVLRHIRDMTYSMALEDQVRLSERFLLTAGVSLHLKNNLQADNYDAPTDSVFAFPGHSDRAFNLLAGVRYNPAQGHALHGHISRKNRFPTMRDRYSYRLGQSIPNPDLSSESSWNFDLGYAFIPVTSLQLKSAVFFSYLNEAIQEVYGVDPDNSAIYQSQNTGNARFYGWEADLVCRPVSSLGTAIQYTLTQRENLSNPDLHFIDVPKHKLLAHVNYTLFSNLVLRVDGVYNSPRTSTSSGIYGTEAFFKVDIKAAFTILSVLTFEASASNLLDAAYSYREGYPAPGRQYLLGFRYQMHPRDY
jgi:iron complex outermembrane receptor protein